ncbi:MAG: hypothetical protein F2786_03885 [Actinobacteria bacterium]|uniref:Unannotated protein n=1 Tax=freshwater metagenome TaxID=449393 RepID=A0A6J7DEB4_9ZZZZ|nr:hypothetical protein [Actinomycetota bacterium]
MLKAILGIDGGGTKTHAVIADLDGNILASAANGAANWERIGITSVQKSLNELIASVLASAHVGHEDIVASTFALAGLDWPEDKVLFEPFLENLLSPGKTHLVNDSIAALFAGAPDGVGCVSIAGTGGKTAGSDGKATLQTMGMELGEGGGAGQLVNLALDSIAKSHHGTAEITQLYLELPKAAGFNHPEEFFTAIARTRVRLDESYAPLIFDLANSGDSSAVDIVTTVAKQHAHDVFGISSQLNFHGKTIKVVRAGGLHTAGCTIFDAIFHSEVIRLVDSAQVSVLEIAPVFGAVIHCAHKYFPTLAPEFIENVLNGAREVEL